MTRRQEAQAIIEGVARKLRVNRDDPYYDRKVYHFAAKVNERGDVSALCYTRPHAINLKRGQSWTHRAEAVTCPRCRKLLKVGAP